MAVLVLFADCCQSRK